jgi:hypothetical protein
MRADLPCRAQRFVAQLAANGSSLRDQGAAGVVKAARRYLKGYILSSGVRRPLSE